MSNSINNEDSQMDEMKKHQSVVTNFIYNGKLKGLNSDIEDCNFGSSDSKQLLADLPRSRFRPSALSTFRPVLNSNHSSAHLFSPRSNQNLNLNLNSMIMRRSQFERSRFLRDASECPTPSTPGAVPSIP